MPHTAPQPEQIEFQVDRAMAPSCDNAEVRCMLHFLRCTMVRPTISPRCVARCFDTGLPRPALNSRERLVAGVDWVLYLTLVGWGCAIFVGSLAQNFCKKLRGWVSACSRSSKLAHLASAQNVTQLSGTCAVMVISVLIHLFRIHKSAKVVTHVGLSLAQKEETKLPVIAMNWFPRGLDYIHYYVLDVHQKAQDNLPTPNQKSTNTRI